MRRQRSFHEIAFRVRQEIANLYLACAQPGVEADAASPLPVLPDPAPVAERLRGSAYAAELERTGEAILQHRFPLLGTEIQTGDEIAWRRDYIHGVESGTSYFRRIPYLDAAQSGDHKIVWELNRHQHMVLLAQMHLLTGRPDCLAGLLRDWESWVAGNPYQRGINWASALEVAFRVLSWTWVYHLAGSRFPADVRGRFLREIYRHGLHLEFNLSVYFSPNTHLLGEAVVLHALGTLFPGFPRAARWRECGGRIVAGELSRQVDADGAHFERSSYYHLYALDFFLLHYVLAGRPKEFEAPLPRMAEYLRALLGPSGDLPLIGDDDGGRVFHPYGRRQNFARATLATCAVLFDKPEWLICREDIAEQAAWWLGAEAFESNANAGGGRAKSRFFPAAGLVRMESPGFLLLEDAGGFGPFQGGHSHSDALSVVAWYGSDEILVDSGTFTYVADPQLRNWFRGSAAHNTVRVDGADQAVPAGPFGWHGKPRVEATDWHSCPEWDYVDACCSHASGAPIRHRRRILFLKPDLVFVIDDVEGDVSGAALIEQFWHPANGPDRVGANCFRIGPAVHLWIDPRAAVSVETGGEHGWRSRALAQKETAAAIVAARRGPLPASLATVLAAGEVPGGEPMSVSENGRNIIVRFAGVEVEFADGARPRRRR